MTKSAADTGPSEDVVLAYDSVNSDKSRSSVKRSEKVASTANVDTNSSGQGSEDSNRIEIHFRFLKHMRCEKEIRKIYPFGRVVWCSAVIEKVLLRSTNCTQQQLVIGYNPSKK